MAKVQDLIANKQGPVHTIHADSTVLEATKKMNEHRIGSLVVVDDGDDAVVGIFTERDVLRRVVAAGVDPNTAKVADVMTAKVVCCTPDQDINEVRAVMRNQRIRHLPVVGGPGELVSLLSIGDINAHDIHNGEVTIRYMEEYIYGRV